MKFKKFIAELQRRNVFRATIAYLAVAWLLVQIASIIFPVFKVPDFFLKILIYLLGAGLIFWVGFSWVYDLTPEGLRKTTASDSSDNEGTNKRLNKVIVLSTSLALLLLISFGIIASSTTGNDSSKFTKVAVVPFTSADTEQEDYLLTGMTDALIDKLSTVDSLMVINQASTRLFTAGFNPSDVLLANKAKEIDYFVVGSLKRLNNILNVEVSLQPSLDDNPIWSKNYSEDISRVEDLWSKVAEDIFFQMGISENRLKEKLITRIKSVNPETYELYLKGKHFLNKSTMDDWKRGIYYLEQAVEENQADPDAWAGLAEGYITLGHNILPPPDVFPKALAASKRAIQLDSMNAEGWAALAHYHTYFGWDWNLAEYAFKKADKLNPNMAYNHYHRAWYLALFGRMNDAITEHRYAQQLDPFSTLHTSWLAELYRWVGLYDEALAEIEKASMMHDDDALSLTIKGRVLMDLGKTDEAIKVFEEAISINSGHKYFGYVQALARLGKRAEAYKIIKEMEQLPEEPYFSLMIAHTYFELNEPDKGFEWLKTAKKHAFYPWIRVMAPDYIKKDPRFLELIKELNLPNPAPLQFDYDRYLQTSTFQ